MEEAPLVAGTVFTGFEFELPTPPVALEWIPFEPQGSYILQRVDEGFSLESQRHGSRHSHRDFVRRLKKKKPSRSSKNDDSGEPGKTRKNKKDYERTTQELLQQVRDSRRAKQVAKQKKEAKKADCEPTQETKKADYE